MNTTVEEAPAKPVLSFQWNYIALPLATFIISIVTAVIFYFQLPDEVAYRFYSDGSPKSWLSREGIIFMLLGLQLSIIAIISLIIRGIINFGRLIEQTDSQLNPKKFMLVMGNIAALPQLVIAIVMLDIFSYNILERHVLSIWLFILIFVIIGSIILTIFFVNAFMRSRYIK
ncbi:MAG: DUF1648 domain-containing protein [Dehalococcoidales bacterium]|nr:DUF1648 domain-containing protein [Dehalococcoidales bacterium]